MAFGVGVCFLVLGILQVQFVERSELTFICAFATPPDFSQFPRSEPMAWAMPERFGLTAAGARVGCSRHDKPAKPFNCTTPRYIRLPGLNTWKAGTPLCVAPAA